MVLSGAGSERIALTLDLMTAVQLPQAYPGHFYPKRYSFIKVNIISILRTLAKYFFLSIFIIHVKKTNVKYNSSADLIS